MFTIVYRLLKLYTENLHPNQTNRKDITVFRQSFFGNIGTFGNIGHYRQYGNKNKFFRTKYEKRVGVGNHVIYVKQFFNFIRSFTIGLNDVNHQNA
jgi:hypothetical protein